MILLDVMPASYTDAAGVQHDQVRAVLTHRRLRVWQAVGRESRLIVDEPHDGVTLESRHPIVGRPVLVPLAAGQVQLVRLRGCGCGSPNKALRPPTDDV